MLLFLDIDGVMVPAKGWKAPEILNDGFPAFSSRAISTLQKLISKDITVVLTTSHKANYSIKEWMKIFENRNITTTNIKALPKNFNHLSRKDEIVNWFNLNNVNEEFIIIDDDKSLNDLPTFLKEKWVQPSPYIGLTENHLDTIKLLLHNQATH